MATLAGIIEAHDLLHQNDDLQLKIGDVARADYVVVNPNELVGVVTQKMLAHHANNVVVEDEGRKAPLGVVRAADLLQLQRRLQEKHLLAPLQSPKGTGHT